MKSNSVCAVCVFVLLLGLAAPAAAHDLWDPPWDTTHPNHTEQGWEADYDYPPEGPLPSPWDLDPTWYENPFGTPVATFSDFQPEWALGPDGDEIVVWRAGPNGGAISITIPNNPDPDLYKELFWQVTSDKGFIGDPGISTVPEGYEVEHLPGPHPQIQHAGTWYTYNGLVKIMPNPEEETITFNFPFETNVSQVVIKTVCIPEPATLAVLGLGGVVVVLRRRRRA